MKKIINVILIFLIIVSTATINYAGEICPISGILDGQGSAGEFYDCNLDNSSIPDLLEDVGSIDFKVNDEGWTGWQSSIWQLMDYINSSRDYQEIAKENDIAILCLAMDALQQAPGECNKAINEVNEDIKDNPDKANVLQKSKTELEETKTRLSDSNMIQKLRAAISYATNAKPKDSGGGPINNGPGYSSDAKKAVKHLRSIQDDIVGKVNVTDSKDTKINYTEEELKLYSQLYGTRFNGMKKEEFFKEWDKAHPDSKKKASEIWSEGEEEADREVEKAKSDGIYEHPDLDHLGKKITTIDGAIDGADGFLDNSDNTIIKASNLVSFSNTIYNIAVIIGVVIAVIVGAIIGIKFMMGSVEEKADVKKLLVPYVIGCIVVFGSFVIWKLIVTMLSGM